MLEEFYNKVKAAHPDDLEIVFVSSDSDLDSFEEYYGHMPWTAALFESSANEVLGSKFGVSGIPTFIVLDAQGHVKDANARATVMSHANNPDACLQKW